MRRSNPFSTCHFAPGAIPYRFPEFASLDSLVDRIGHSPAQRAAIVGPHGSGKSTLVAHLLSAEVPRSHWSHLDLVRLSSSEPSGRRFQRVAASMLKDRPTALHGRTLLCIDGWEQLAGPAQTILRVMARLRSLGLLATSHRPLRGFETVWETDVDALSERYVLSWLLARSPGLGVEQVLNSPEYRASRNRHGQNLRETLFDLYDWYRDHVDVDSPPR